MNAVSLVLLGAAGCALLAVYYLIQSIRELRFAKGILSDVIPSGRIRGRNDLVAIKAFLTHTINYDRSRVEEPRPLLRWSPSQILRTGYGYCGENTRVAIVLLGLGGVRAHRLYLQGERFGHVAAEVLWQGKWTLFDAHRDPKTLLPDEQIADIDSGQLDAFPNGYPENPWIHAYRIKLFERIGFLRRWANRRVPGAMAVLMELPAFWKFIALGGAAALLLLLT